jgi:cytochrome c oxidase subunit 2
MIAFILAFLLGTPRVIEIHAKRFVFAPDIVTLKHGERVTIRLISDDRAHGLLVKPLGLDLDASPSDSDEITIVVPAPGTYPAICDHYCGMGHGGMKMTFIVQ